MASKNTELKLEQQQKKTQEYLDAYKEAYEQHITPLNIKYGLRLIPTIVTNQIGGMNPAYGLEKYTREEVSPQDPVSKESTPDNEKQLEAKTD